MSGDYFKGLFWSIDFNSCGDHLIDTNHREKQMTQSRMQYEKIKKLCQSCGKTVKQILTYLLNIGSKSLWSRIFMITTTLNISLIMRKYFSARRILIFFNCILLLFFWKNDSSSSEGDSSVPLKSWKTRQALMGHRWQTSTHFTAYMHCVVLALDHPLHLVSYAFLYCSLSWPTSFFLSPTRSFIILSQQ